MSTIEVNTITPQSGTTLTLGGSGDTVSVASGVTNNLGITEIDLWELTAMASGSSEPISSNLARATGLGGYKGTGMSVSSGVWTFPSTGYWSVTFQVQVDEQGGLGDNVDLNILHSNNGGSSWNFNTRVTETLDNSDNSKARPSSTTILKISDTTNHVIRFDVTALDASNRIMGVTGSRYTTFLFIKLGEL